MIDEFHRLVIQPAPDRESQQGLTIHVRAVAISPRLKQTIYTLPSIHRPTGTSRSPQGGKAFIILNIRINARGKHEIHALLQTISGSNVQSRLTILSRRMS